MLDSVVTFVRDELNSSILHRTGQREDRVIASPIVGQDGSVAILDENRLVITMLDVEKEAALVNASRYRYEASGVSSGAPAAQLNVYLMVSAYFSAANYTESLRYLSYAIGFFQANSTFAATSHPELSRQGIQKLTLEMFSPDFHTKSNLWSALGAKYMPSVMYKARVVQVDMDRAGDQLPPITAINNEHHG